MPIDTAPVIDAKQRVTGRIVSHSTRNDALSRVIVEEAFYTSSELALEATLLPDGISVPVSYDPTTGAFSFERLSNERYRLVNSRNGVAYEDGASHLELVQWFVGRRNRAIVTTSMDVTFQLAAPITGVANVLSTGLWTQTGLPYPVADADTITLDWKAATSISGAVGLLDADEHDEILLAEFAVSAEQHTLANYLRAPLRQIDGIDELIEGALTPVSPLCATITGGFAREHARVSDVENRVAFGAGWSVRAIASLEFPFGGLTVAKSIIGPPTDVDIDIAFGNPIAGTALVATMGIIGDRTLTLPGTIGRKLGVGTRHYIPIDETTTCPANATSLVGGMAFARSTTIAGIVVDSDGTMIALDGRDPLVTWQLAASGPADLARISLYELLDEAGATVAKQRYQVTTAIQQVSIPRTLLATGKHYVLRIDLDLGYPNAGSGDYRLVTYPAGGSTNYSGWFTVE